MLMLTALLAIPHLMAGRNAAAARATAYYDVPVATRWNYAARYLGLTAFLALMTHELRNELMALRAWQRAADAGKAAFGRARAREIGGDTPWHSPCSPSAASIRPTVVADLARPRFRPLPLTSCRRSNATQQLMTTLCNGRAGLVRQLNFAAPRAQINPAGVHRGHARAHEGGTPLPRGCWPDAA